VSPGDFGPVLLIASPQMRDAVFERTVVLLWHHDDEGAIGVVVNKAVDHKLADVLLLDEGMDAVPEDDQSQVRWGGPVDTGMGTVVTLGAVDDDEGWSFPCGINVTRSQEALVRLLRDRAPMLLCLGYAGWGPGQLDKEIEAGGWLFADVDVDLVFKEPSDNVYDKALQTLGLTPGKFWMAPISE